jgi:putative hemolysin
VIAAGGFNLADGALLIAVGALIAFSALLALAETGLVRTSRARARALAEQGRHGAVALDDLVEHPDNFLAPVLLLVLICQLVAATLVGVIAARLFGAFGVAAATVFEVVVIFVAAEAVPKHWAVSHPDRAALFSAPFVTRLISFVPVRVVSAALVGISHLALRVIARGDDAIAQPEVTESELLALADVAVEAEVIEARERELLSSIIDFGDTIVREVMAPRPDIRAMRSDEPLAQAVETAISLGRSRLPVYGHSLDDITGIVYTRDLLAALRRSTGDPPVSTFARPAHFVPESKRVAPLLREMQAEQFQIAVVVDEYGQTSGIVTLEDLVEELVGEIADELDSPEPLVERIGEGVWRCSGSIAIDEVNDLLGANLPEGDWDTLAGLLLHLVGAVPREGAAVTLEGWEFVAEKVQRRRIRSIVVRPATELKGTD